MHMRSLLALGLMLCHGWVAAQTAAAQPALSLDDARAQRVRAKALKSEAETRYETEKTACQGRIIAIDCMSSAKERRAESLRKADALDQEGLLAEREVHNREVAAKAAKREAEAPAREAKQQADVANYREKEAQHAAARVRGRAEESAKVEKRRSKLAAEKATRERKLAERRQEEAKRAAEAPERARKRAEELQQHAERVKRIDERARQYAEVLKRREAEKAATQAAQSAAAAAK